MQAFLADYGMIWVGEDDADDDALNISDVYHHDLDEEEEEDANTVPPIGEQTDSLWQPGKIVHCRFIINVTTLVYYTHAINVYVSSLCKYP